MHRYATYVAAFCIAVLGSHASAANCTTPANVNQLATEIATGLNINRAAQGLGQVRFNPKLGQAAMAHACDMAVNNYFGHVGTDGSSVQRRVRATGYQDCLIAENLAWGYPQSQQIISGWMNSAGHRSNMLHPRVVEFGVGITQGPKGPNWVLVLGKGCA